MVPGAQAGGEMRLWNLPRIHVFTDILIVIMHNSGPEAGMTCECAVCAVWPAA